jgi:hypothetical protein
VNAVMNLQKMLGNYQVTTYLVASRVVLSSIDLVRLILFMYRLTDSPSFNTVFQHAGRNDYSSMMW